MLTATQYIEKKKVLETALTILLTRRFNGADNSGPTINTIYEFYSCYKVEGYLQMKKKKKKKGYICAPVCVFSRDARSVIMTDELRSLHSSSAVQCLLQFDAIFF